MIIDKFIQNEKASRRLEENIGKNVADKGIVCRIYTEFV